ncbi:MAG TPA: glycosyltransferase [Ramlibacter sp.]|nr:glycosyltransferase [Ramlibacter sp.]
MFSLGDLPPVAHRDPWHLSLQDRLRLLARRGKRVAYFYELADNSTFRYRVHNMVEVLNHGRDEVGASYFFLADLERLDEIADLADLLVICRTRYDHRVNHLIGAFRKRRKRVLFDIDDFVFNTEHVHLIIKTLDLDVRNQQTWHDWFSYNGRLGATLKLCDAGITTNEFLAARMHEFAGIPVAVIPNFMNPEQLALSERVFAAKARQQPGQDGLIHLGYFSGSPSHNRDFGIVIPALEELLEHDERLGVVVVGYIEAGPRLERFGSRVTRFPFHDYVNLQRLIGSVEFNLMPLQFNTFTDCKSELKYFEAAAVGTLCIASPSHVYARAIRHADNGYLARAYEWADVIRQALNNLPHYREMAEHARDDAISKYAWFHQRERILDALGLS